jgi:hypothetical protein
MKRYTVAQDLEDWVPLLAWLKEKEMDATGLHQSDVLGETA